MKKTLIFMIMIAAMIAITSCEKEETTTDNVVTTELKDDPVQGPYSMADMVRHWDLIPPASQEWIWEEFCELTGYTGETEDELAWMGSNTTVVWDCCQDCGALMMTTVPYALVCPNTHCPEPCHWFCNWGENCDWTYCVSNL